MSGKYAVILSGIIICIGILLFWNGVSDVFSPKNSKAVVVIDVGHGGMDPGKVSEDGTREKDINLQIARCLRDYLIAQDYTVYMTRETDCDLSDSGASGKKSSDMRNRVAFITDHQADYVISIHQNSFPDASSHGAQVFYYDGSHKGKHMANYIQNALLDMDDTNKRQAKSNGDYYILKKSDVPTVIVECGFLSNKKETASLKDTNYQKQLAYAICMGFCNYAESE